MMKAFGRKNGFIPSQRRTEQTGTRTRRKVRHAAIALLCLFALACCSTAGTGSGITEGKALLDEGRYPQAKNAFLRAGEDRADAAALAFAATAAYKAKEIPEAARLLDAADRFREQGGALLRIAGYKSLVLFAQGKEAAGLDSLKRYIDLFNSLGATMLNTTADTRDMERMLKTRQVNAAVLETTMDRQINAYEDDYREVSRGIRQGR
jgi:tetratricopeptide (TPR) repeat protein